MTTPRVSMPTFAGRRTRMLEVDGSTPTFVLLHGYLDSANTWDGVLHELSVRGHAAVAVDLPGFGNADLPEPGPAMAQLDAFVAELVEHRARRGPVVLVGNSLGGTLAVRAAAAGLPLLGAVTIGDPSGGRWRFRMWAGSARTPLVLRLAAIPLPVPAPVLRVVTTAVLRRLMYADHRTADRTVVARFTDFVRDRGGLPWLLRDVTALSKELRTGHGEVQASCGLLIVHGANDRVVPVGASKALHAETPASELAIVPAWGHCPQLDDPAALTGLVTRTAAAWLSDAPQVGDLA